MTNKQGHSMRNHRLWRLITALTLLLGALPMLLYAGARLFGALPSEAVWQAQHYGGNHGPWWDTVEGLAIYLSDLGLIALMMATLGACSVALLKRRGTVLLLLSGLVLVVLQAVLVLSHFWFLFWTID